jgi:ParB family chromosome partitioning protein
MNNIQFIKISAIHPHPDNPRKDLGDLTELADSIKTAGVMQNLTVVPHKSIEGEYTVIIGHRRLGASKLAGLDTVPCVVTEMTDKEQLATMMLENMQRSDLTVYEQAKGFQLMMDFGETVDSIADKTGLSKTTIRNRVKIAKYDQDVMR